MLEKILLAILAIALCGSAMMFIASLFKHLNDALDGEESEV